MFRIVIVILPMRSQFQRNFIFVIVILIIRSQADKDSEIGIRKIVHIQFRRLGMRKQLQTLVLAQIVVRILIYGTCILGGKVRYL